MSLSEPLLPTPLFPVKSELLPLGWGGLQRGEGNLDGDLQFPLPAMKEKIGQPWEPGSSVLLGLESVVKRLLLNLSYGRGHPHHRSLKNKAEDGGPPFPVPLRCCPSLPAPGALGVRFRGHQWRR